MKKIKWASAGLLTLVIPFLCGAYAPLPGPPPVPGTWFREGPVTFGDFLYLNDIQVGLTAGSNSPAFITHTVSSIDNSDFDGQVVLPFVQYAGQNIIIGNESPSSLVITGPSNASINGQAVPRGLSGIIWCVSTSARQTWLCSLAPRE